MHHCNHPSKPDRQNYFENGAQNGALIPLLAVLTRRIRDAHIVNQQL